jgi:hypothetical protein
MEETPTPPSRHGRLKGAVWFAGSLFLATLAAAPSLLVHTPARNLLLRSAIRSETLQATAQSATGGWFKPLAFHNLRLEDSQGQVSCRIGRLQTSRGLMSFLLTRSSPTHVELHDAMLRVELNDDGTWPECGRQQSSKSTLHYAIHNGAFQLKSPTRPLPIVDLTQLNLSGRIGPDPAGRRELTVEPCTLLDHAALSDAHASQNLALVAPILSQTTRIAGAASVSLEAIRVPLDGPEPASPFPLRGRVEFHALDASLRPELLQQLALFIPSAAAKLPSRIAVLDDLAVSFEVTESGIRHDGMVVLLPELARNLQITSSGTIGLDEALQLDVEIRLPQTGPDSAGGTTEDAPEHASPLLSALLAGLTSAPLQLHVTGTIHSPQVALPNGMTIAGELLRRLAPGTPVTAAADKAAPASGQTSVPGAVAGLIREISNQKTTGSVQNLPGSIIDLIRAVDKSAKERKQKRAKKTSQ